MYANQVQRASASGPVSTECCDTGAGAAAASTAIEKATDALRRVGSSPMGGGAAGTGGRRRGRGRGMPWCLIALAVVAIVAVSKS